MESKAPYRELRAKLPTWVVIGLRMLVEDSNAKLKNEPPWTVSVLLESMLVQSFTTKQLDTLARKSPEFKRAAEAWLRWVARRDKKK